MIRTKIAAALGALTLAAACDVNIAEREAGKLDSYDLSEHERAVAEALIEGYKKEMNMPALRSRDYSRAACYAKMVNMPSRHDAVHIAYLRDYPSIDENFYPWFANKGYSDQDAWKIGERVQKGYAECSFKALVKNRLAKN